MYRWLPILFLFTTQACGPGMATGVNVTPGSFSDVVQGIYKGRMTSHLVDTTDYTLSVIPVNDSTIRIEPRGSENTSAFIALLNGPSPTVLKIYYQDEQIGTIIAGVMKYRRSMGLDYSEYFSGSLVRQKNGKNQKTTAQ